MATGGAILARAGGLRYTTMGLKAFLPLKDDTVQPLWSPIIVSSASSPTPVLTLTRQLAPRLEEVRRDRLILTTQSAADDDASWGVAACHRSRSLIDCTSGCSRVRSAEEVRQVLAAEGCLDIHANISNL